MPAPDKTTTTGNAVTLSWPEPDIALATMTREREMNTLSLELLEELDAALTASVAGGARALIITGQGRAFCAGAHLRYFTSEDAELEVAASRCATVICSRSRPCSTGSRPCRSPSSRLSTALRWAAAVRCRSPAISG